MTPALTGRTVEEGRDSAEMGRQGGGADRVSSEAPTGKTIESL